MTRKIKAFLALSLVIQLLIPAYLLIHHYSVTNTALESATEYRFRINSMHFDIFSDVDVYECKEISFSVEEIVGFYNQKIAVSLNENGMPVLEELKDKKQTDTWFDYDYYDQKTNLYPEDFTFADGIDIQRTIRKIKSEYSWFNRKDENKTYAYLTAKIYKGVFIPTAIYFNGVKIITINNE